MEFGLGVLLGVAIGFVFGAVAQWVADLPREHRR
jgi:hypothetical protein